jgi:phytanoyl-CoA hydroxylase
MPTLSATQVEDFRRDGFVVLAGMADSARCAALVEEIDRCLDPPLGPVEFEADLGYPGAPANFEGAGGRTPRRLLNAYSRGPLFREWARAPALLAAVCRLLDAAAINLVQAHHNCIMTKYPDFGSRTGWHQDIRYWRFDRPDLVNAWLALGPEDATRGGLQVIPGSHGLALPATRFDEAQFLREDLPENQPLLAQARSLDLDRGDVLFFHCRLLHAADRNRSAGIKRSLVFTYNRRGNAPVPDTRSARLAEIPLAQS